MKNKKVTFNDIVEIRYYNKSQPIENNNNNNKFYILLIITITICILLSLLL